MHRRRRLQRRETASSISSSCSCSLSSSSSAPLLSAAIQVSCISIQFPRKKKKKKIIWVVTKFDFSPAHFVSRRFARLHQWNRPPPQGHLVKISSFVHEERFRLQNSTPRALCDGEERKFVGKSGTERDFLSFRLHWAR